MGEEAASRIFRKGLKRARSHWPPTFPRGSKQKAAWPLTECVHKHIPWSRPPCVNPWSKKAEDPCGCFLLISNPLDSTAGPAPRLCPLPPRQCRSERQPRPSALCASRDPATGSEPPSGESQTQPWKRTNQAQRLPCDERTRRGNVRLSNGMLPKFVVPQQKGSRQHGPNAALAQRHQGSRSIPME